MAFLEEREEGEEFRFRTVDVHSCDWTFQSHLIDTADTLGFDLEVQKSEENKSMHQLRHEDESRPS